MMFAVSTRDYQVLHEDRVDDDQDIAREGEGECCVTIIQPLPTIEEGSVLLIENQDGYDEDENNSLQRSIESSAGSSEKTSLVKSTGSFKSYTDNIHQLTDTQEHDASQMLTFSEADQFSDYQSSTMTDFHASWFLPSLMLSSYSTIKQSYDQQAQQELAQSIARRSLHGSRSVAVSLIEQLSDDRGASVGFTFFNLMPYLIGSSLFAMPYAIAKGGYLTITSFLFTAFLADVTAIVLVDAMYEISPKSKQRKRVRRDYVEIARAAFGEKAAKFMNFLLLCHLFTNGIVSLVLIGQAMFAILFPYVPLSKKQLMAIFSAAVVPTLFVRKLSQVAYMSTITTMALITGAVATLGIFIKEGSSWKFNVESVPLFDWNYFAYALSMWLYALIIHSTLPQIEGSMRTSASINKAVHMSMALSTFIKATFGLMGALAFGAATKVLVTDNVIEISYPVNVLLNAVVAIYCIFGFPLFFFVICDAFDDIVLRNKYPKFERHGKYRWLWVLLTRCFLVAVALAIAIVVPYFGPLVGVFGSILGTLLVFVLPCLFHLKLKWKQLSAVQKTVEILIIATGSVFGVIGLYASVKQLYTIIRSGKNGN